MKVSVIILGVVSAANVPHSCTLNRNVYDKTYAFAVECYKLSMELLKADGAKVDLFDFDYSQTKTPQGVSQSPAHTMGPDAQSKSDPNSASSKEPVYNFAKGKSNLKKFPIKPAKKNKPSKLVDSVRKVAKHRKDKYRKDGSGQASGGPGSSKTAAGKPKRRNSGGSVSSPTTASESEKSLRRRSEGSRRKGVKDTETGGKERKQWQVMAKKKKQLRTVTDARSVEIMDS